VPARPLNTIVWLDVEARALIEEETLKRPRVETGGALFGFTTDDNVVIACAYGPGPRARHRRTTFEPHPATTQALIDAICTESGARYRYLGSWHSHPGSIPRPSCTDVRTTEAVASEPHVRLAAPVVLIQSTRRGPGRLVEIGNARAWRWSCDDDWLLPCELVPVELEERYCPIVEVPGGRLRGGEALSPRAGG
jgi:integrative and conjugative element protein (TIGR02256 family)